MIVSAIAHVQLLHMHPFLDGNGRTSRRLSMLYLHRAGYNVERLIATSLYDDRDRTACYDAIPSVRRMPMDMTRWTEFFTHGLATQLAEVRHRGAHAMQQDVLARRLNLTERQLMAVGVVLDQQRLTITDGQRRYPGTPRRALHRDLRGLIEKGVLIRRGPTSRVAHLLARGAACACVRTCARLAPQLAPPARASDASPQRACQPLGAQAAAGIEKPNLAQIESRRDD